MTHETHELNINELDAVSGGLRRIPDEDRFNQALANANKADGTVGGSLQGNLITPTSFGGEATGGHTIDF
jgi:bacteriocin-like protein